MKIPSIIVKVDKLGRIIIPYHIRGELKVEEKDFLYLVATENRIIIQRISNQCILCHSRANVVSFKGKKVCRQCIESLKKAHD